MEIYELRQKQSLPLDIKLSMTKRRIRQWYEYWKGNIYIAFSGGKDSTVLLNIVRSLYPNVPAVYVNTGLEYPEINEFVNEIENVVILRPKMNFKQVLDNYGVPIISKKVARQIRELRNPTKKNEATRKLFLTGITRNGNKTSNFKLSEKWKYLVDAPFGISEECCNIMKKNPIKQYEKDSNRKGITGMMASDSMLREKSYLKIGCNNYTGMKSNPLSFWLEKDIWDYIKKNNIKYCSIYDTGVKRTGCIFCMFGIHLEKTPNRFQLMQDTHPKLYKYCMNNLGLKEVLEYIHVPYKKPTTLGKWCKK